MPVNQLKLVNPEIISFDAWSPEYIKQELDYMLDKARLDDTVLFMKELCHERNYSEAMFRKKTENHRNEEWFADIQTFIDEILEIRLAKYGLGGKSQPMVMFLLKKNYGYSDQPEESKDVNINVEMKEID
jgi:hypothetical protein